MRRFKVSRETVKEADPKRQDRNKRYRAGLEERGIKAFQVVAPETAKGLFRRAAELMTRDDDPMEPRQAMRLAGGANEPEPGDQTLALLAELDAARSRIAAIELEAEKHRVEVEARAEARQRALQGDLDATRAAEAAERDRAANLALAAQEVTMAAKAASGRAEKAEAVIRQAKALPGLKGRLVRWLAGDVLE